MEENQLARRQFLAQGIGLAGAAVLASMPFSGFPSALPTSYTVQDVINIILKSIPGAPFSNTVDTLKSGTADQRVSGIVTTMFPTMDVLETALSLKANFIIVHEPSFYNHLDDRNWVPNNSVVNLKYDWLQKHQLCIWRFHDAWHARRPDGILYGVLKKSGWLSYNPAINNTFTIPAIALADIVSQLKSTLGISTVRIIGDPKQICSKISFFPGAAGGETHVSNVEKENPDLLVVGELQEWETAEYIRDARKFGRKTALLILGHAVSEEPGTEYLRDWLQPQVPEIKITHVPSGDPFIWI
jgi:putative NIF3 family GTP cyclohydrolase 1 type 2